MEGEGGGERGHAKGPPGRGRRAGPSEGRAEAAPRRAHTRIHALPLHPRPLPARGAAPRPRGTVQPVGDCRQLQGRPPPSPPRPACGAPAGPAPTAPASPQLQASPPHRASAASPSPPEEKRKKVRQRGADLAWEGKRVSLVSLLPVLLPAPAQLRALEPLRSGTRPVGSAARAPKGDRQPAEPHGWSAPAKRRVARSVSH